MATHVMQAPCNSKVILFSLSSFLLLLSYFTIVHAIDQQFIATNFVLESKHFFIAN